MKFKHILGCVSVKSILILLGSTPRFHQDHESANSQTGLHSSRQMRVRIETISVNTYIETAKSNYPTAFPTLQENFSFPPRHHRCIKTPSPH